MVMSKLKVLVTGAGGQLGTDLCAELKVNNIDFVPLTISDVDITDEQAVKDAIKSSKVDIVIHCAAYTNVDQAEENKDLAYAVNTLGTKYIAEACKEINAKLMYISTDYVFDGEGTKFFTETDQANPVNWYGQTKYEGEVIVQELIKDFFILRISWVFGLNGHNFVKTMLKLGSANEEINVVSDQIGSPTNTADLSKIIVEMIQTKEYGIYHVTNEGTCSWAEFAETIFNLSGINCKVNPILTKDYKTIAKRPLNSRMSKEKIIGKGFYKLPSWKTSLKKYLENN